MNKQLILFTTLALTSLVLVQSCAEGQSPQASAPPEEQASPTEQTTTEQTTTETANSGETGTLEIRANGEDFVRQGFTTKDGWQIDFDHVYVNLDQVTAYQTDPPFNPESTPSAQPQSKAEVQLEGINTVDLAEGDENAEPIVVGEVPAPVGRYNALSWQMVKAPDGPAAGYPLVMQGTATKDGQTVNFDLRIDEELGFTCGDFVGDDRKGILTAGNAADLEATFHFDHLFGDADTPADDALNTDALGFEPLAAVAQNGQLDADLATLREQLSQEDYTKLVEILPSLGHVGEGHCQETTLTS